MVFLLDFWKYNISASDETKIPRNDNRFYLGFQKSHCARDNGLVGGLWLAEWKCLVAILDITLKTQHSHHGNHIHKNHRYVR